MAGVTDETFQNVEYHDSANKYFGARASRVGPYGVCYLENIYHRCGTHLRAYHDDGDGGASLPRINAYADKLPFGGAGFITAPYGPYWRFVKKLCVTSLLSARQLERSKKVRKEEIKGSVGRVLENAREKGGAIDLGSEFMKLTNSLLAGWP
ncbi:unnamed protein product [Sphenostylis stenocarpa]|uniref:Cytochrome P450 n=1 Tax=Sphenostylis stenocarpa TaxID=92480 RepID=A0AA87B8I6_9FABA|nr:unnamed protein product [Sphenostylis stenocarpa]